MTFEEVQSMLEEKVSKSDLQYLLSNKVSVEELGKVLEHKASSHEMHMELQSLNNKVEELHRELQKRMQGCAL